MSVNEGRYFYLRKLYSLSGVVPLGLFLFEHLFSNSYALLGPERFDSQVKALHSIPFLLGVELVLIILPLLYHGIYGLYIAFTGQINTGRYGYGRNWGYVFQRVTGVITLVFVTWHVWTLRVMDLMNGTVVSFDTMKELFSNPAVTVIYGIAVVSAIYHFTNGLWGVLVDWGIVTGPRAQARVAACCWAIFTVLTIVSISFMAAFI
ncbi:hypothetical protein SY88_15315 [Clostridiales bacterium PH28_bin88]|nr:hypothetical protein SY88_15315 [Clostridiales bacterium PH28_bin88]